LERYWVLSKKSYVRGRNNMGLVMTRAESDDEMKYFYDFGEILKREYFFIISRQKQDRPSDDPRMTSMQNPILK
jgi:hypothetical protein